MKGWVPAYVGLGSNINSPLQQLEQALQHLQRLPDTRLVAKSSPYRSKPFGPVAQDDFCNAVAALLTTLPAADLLAELRKIEAVQGRERRERWGPRTLDLDLLIYGQQIIATESLTVPHPGIAERAFVLQPLLEVAPDLNMPGLGRVGNLWQTLNDAEKIDISIMQWKNP